MWRSFRVHRFLEIVLILLLCSSSAHAGGFALLEQSAEGVGNGFAGAAAGYGDGSEVSFNPAGMSWIDSTTITFHSHLITPSAEFTNEGSRNVVTGLPISGSDGPDGGSTAFIPNFYVVHPTTDSLHLGFGVNTPFGLKTEYNREWVGRYDAIKSELTTINLMPAVSYKISDDFSVGATMQVMYADAELSNMIDFGTIGAGVLGLPAATAAGLIPGATDGFGEVEGDDWGAGYIVGASYRHAPQSRVGISWRSKIDLSITGNGRFEVPDAALPLTAGGFFTDTGVVADVTLPDYLNLGWIHQIDEQWSVLGEIQWTHWSRLEELRVRFANGQPDSVTPENWDNTFRYSLAANYRPIEDLVLKAGFTYDQSPIPNDEHRTPRIPGEIRRWLALGIGYDFTEEISGSLNYVHIFVSDGASDITDDLGNNFKGDWDLTTDIVSANVTYRF